jgi:hypothetical protein
MRIGWVSVALTLCVACGGRVSGDGGDAGAAQQDGSAMETPDGGQGPGQTIFGVCPAEPPQPDDPCVSPGQGCVYVNGPSCQTLICSDAGRWASSQLGC